MSICSTDLLLRAHSQGLADGFINFWVGLIGSLVDPVGPETTVLEFGATGSKFLRLLYLVAPYKRATGVVLAEDADGGDHKWASPPTWPGSFVPEAEAGESAQPVDLAFSTEVLGLLPDLRTHAATMSARIRPGGCYYTSLGWHSDNPHLERHVSIRRSRGLPFYSYSLDDVAHAFHDAGFEVGFKRLKIPYFLMFDPVVTAKRFGTVASMITCLEDHRVVFSFRRLGGS